MNFFATTVKRTGLANQRAVKQIRFHPLILLVGSHIDSPLVGSLSEEIGKSQNEVGM